MKLSIAFRFILPFLVRTSEGAQAEEDDYVNFGLALNGGSFTAANGCASVMRGFQQQTITRDGEDRPAMEAFDLVSGLSGGNFPNVQYHYAENTNSNELLDAAGINDPKDITAEELNSIPKKSLFTAMVDSLVPSVGMALIKKVTYGSDVWAETIYNHLLGPDATVIDPKIRDDVHSTPLIELAMIGPADVFPAWVDNSMSVGIVDELKKILQNTVLFEDYEGVSFLNNNTFMLEVLKNNGFQSPLPGFGTPEKLYVPFSSEVKMEFDDKEGNKITELSFKPVAASHDEMSSESSPFRMKKLLAIGTDLWTIRPELRNLAPPYEPLTALIPTADGDMREMAFTDAGYVDGTGIPALVNKKTKNIISVWCPSPGQRKSDIVSELKTAIGPFFGILPRDTEFPPEYHFLKLNGIHNHMFNLNSNGENQMEKLIETMLSLDAAGEPTITTLKDVEVIDNPFWGISGGWKLDFTLCLFTGVPTNFAKEISEGVFTPPGNEGVVVNRLFTNEAFKSVPNVVGIEPTDGDLIGSVLPREAARMTQIMLSWAIKYSWEGLEVNGEIKFGGFRAIFEEKGKSHKSKKLSKSKKPHKSALSKKEKKNKS